jgi:hypothetical protein
MTLTLLMTLLASVGPCVATGVHRSAADYEEQVVASEPHTAPGAEWPLGVAGSVGAVVDPGEPAWRRRARRLVPSKWTACPVTGLLVGDEAKRATGNGVLAST